MPRRLCASAVTTVLSVLSACATASAEMVPHGFREWPKDEVVATMPRLWCDKIHLMACGTKQCDAPEYMPRLELALDMTQGTAVLGTPGDKDPPGKSQPLRFEKALTRSWHRREVRLSMDDKPLLVAIAPLAEDDEKISFSLTLGHTTDEVHVMFGDCRRSPEGTP